MMDVDELDEDDDEGVVAAPMENPTTKWAVRQYVPTSWMPVTFMRDERGTRQTDEGWWT